MQNILSNIIISVNDKLYVKNPETSELGKKIIEQSILPVSYTHLDVYKRQQL